MATGYTAGIGLGGGGSIGLSLGIEQNHFGDGTDNHTTVMTQVDDYGTNNPDWLDNYDAHPKNYIVLDYKDAMGNRYTEALVRHYNAWAVIGLPAQVDLTHEGISELQDVQDYSSKLGRSLVATSATATDWVGAPTFLKSQANADTLTTNEVVTSNKAGTTFTESDYTSVVSTDAGDVVKVDVKALDDEVQSKMGLISGNGSTGWDFYGVGDKIAYNVQRLVGEGPSFASLTKQAYVEISTTANKIKLSATSESTDGVIQFIIRDGKNIQIRKDHIDFDQIPLKDIADGVDATDAVTKQQLDTAISEVLDFTTYKSFSDFSAAVTARGGSLTFEELGAGGQSDDQVRGNNMAVIFGAMLDREQIFWSAGAEYQNIFPTNYVKAFFERLNTTRCSANMSTKSGSKFYDFSQESTSSAGVWKKRVSEETDGNVILGSSKLIHNDKTDPTVSGSSGFYTETNKAHVFAHNSITLTINNKDIVLGNIIDFAEKDLTNTGNLILKNTTDKSVSSEDNMQQFVKFKSDGGLTLSAEDSSNAINIKFGGSSAQTFNSTHINFNHTKAINLADGVNTSDGATLGQTTLLIEDEFNHALSPTDFGDSQLIDESVTSQNNGYGKNKTLTYSGIQVGLNNNLDTDYSLIWGIHERINSTTIFLHLHEDFIEQKIDSGNLTGIYSLGVLIEGGKAALAKSNMNAPSSGLWDFAGRAVPNTDPNSTTNTNFLDSDGNATDAAGAFKATYSSGAFRNIGSILFRRGYVNVVNDATPATFHKDDSSPFFVGLASAGGGTFNVRKQFIVMSDASKISTQLYYETTADVVGGNIKSNTENIDLIDERVSNLEEDTIVLGADANNVVETISVSNSNSGSFSMLDNATKTFELPIVDEVMGFDIAFTITDSSGSNREFKKVHVFNDGSGFTITEGVAYGHEFTQLAFSYDTSSSSTSGNSTLSIIGSGSGATLNLTYKTSKTFGMIS